jgi:hypothetical protein
VHTAPTHCRDSHLPKRAHCQSRVKWQIGEGAQSAEAGSKFMSTKVYTSPKHQCRRTSTGMALSPLVNKQCSTIRCTSVASILSIFWLMLHDCLWAPVCSRAPQWPVVCLRCASRGTCIAGALESVHQLQKSLACPEFAVHSRNFFNNFCFPLPTAVSGCGCVAQPLILYRCRSSYY